MKNILAFSLFICISFSACKTKRDSPTQENCKTEAKENCMCTMQYDPVCGCDGKTYGNACSAQCQGVTKWTAGECK